MKVALDGTPLTVGVGGIARYTAELYRALMETFPEDAYKLVTDQVSPPGNWLERRWWTIGIHRAIRNCDVFHGTDFAVPYLPLRASVMTIHDLSPWKERAWHHAADRVRRRTPFLAGLGLATMIVTPSEAIRREVIERFAVSPSRVAATPLAAAPHLRPAPVPRGNYFLFAGVLEPRKNLPMLVEAWRRVRNNCAVDLVLAGRRREDFPALPPQPGLHIKGEVKEEELPALYSGAIACVYPSLYEGFGLPVLEAMQCGAAVIASRDPAITEVAGGAAVQVDADDVRGWTAAMTRAAADSEWVRGLRERSLKRAAQFSWGRTARLTRAVYEEARSRFGG